MLTEHESTEVFKTLAKYLHDHNLDWVLEQVMEQIRFGVEEKKRVRVGNDVPWQDQNEEVRPRRSNVMFAATRPYGEAEKLCLLIDAIQQAVVNTVDMDANFRKELSVLEVPHSGVLVREELEPRIIEITETPDLGRYKDAHRLGELLHELRSEVA